MNRIVRNNYPLANLPEDLRAGFAEDRPVSVTVQQEPKPSQAAANLPDEEPIEGGDFTRLKHLRRANFASSEEVDAYIDTLRNEWSDRER